VPVRSERQRDRAGSVQASRHQPTRTDDQDRPARAASVAPKLHHGRFRRSRCRLRPQHLSLHQTVTDYHQQRPHRLPRRLAAWASGRPRLCTRRHPLAPGLDSRPPDIRFAQSVRFQRATAGR
jgi:hypothetical protein